MPVTVNIPVEVNAGTHATNVTVQGETVSYNYLHIPLKYNTVSGDLATSSLSALFKYKEDADSSQVLVDVSGSTTGLQTVLETALSSIFLTPYITSGVVFSDNSSRNLSTNPLKYYENATTHMTASDVSGASLVAYVREYLYDNLASTVGLAETTGALSISLDIQSVATQLLSQLTGSGITSQAIRQNIYEQLYQLAPSRFSAGTNATFQPLPFQAGDSLVFLITFQFPSSLISTPVYQNVMRLGNSPLFIDTGHKIQVLSGTTTPVVQNFPDCTVLLRVIFTE